MINRISFALAFMVMVLCSCTAAAEVKVNVAPSLGINEVELKGMALSDMLNPSANRQPAIVEKSFTLKNGATSFELPVDSFGRYMLTAGETTVNFWAAPGDNLLIQITAPGDYTVRGTVIMDDLTDFSLATKKVDDAYAALMASGNATQETVMPLVEEYQAILADFIKSHSQSPALPAIMDELEPEDYLEVFASLSQEVKKSPLYPLAEANAQRLAEKMEVEKKREALQSGSVDAPDFTLENLQGKKVSLSDFRGKWVVLDFWGSWCKWCIKGFPELKKAYAQYAGKLEIIGVDCRESKEDWKAGVERYNLPWVQVYNPEGSGLLEKYYVEGFPTKVIVSPEGKIVNITVGEDPKFFDILAGFIK